ncbi:MAG: LamG-like jellyroll fold domain-containing protein [Verrucomicrobiota bacterium]
MFKKDHIRAFGVAAVLACLPVLASADVFSDYEAPGGRNAYHTDPSVNSRRTDHFLIRFGPKPKEGFMVEQMYQGQLQFLENCYDTWQSLGLRPLGGTDPNTKYKLIIQPHETWDGDTAGTAVSFGETIAGTSYWVPGIHIPGNSLGYKAPNGTTPHECTHNWQNQGGLPATTPQGLTESLANWGEQLAIAGYPQDWTVVGMPMGHAAVGYNCMSLFNYFMDAPGYGATFINKLVFDTNLNTAPDYLSDDVIRKAIRVDTSGAVDKAGAIHDGLGMMNAKMLGMDFWNHRVNSAYTYDQDLTWSGYQWNRIPMVRQPGVSGIWYRPEWTCVPQSLMNSYIPLNVTATGSLRSINCDFRPVADAVRGTSFRACFVAFGQSKEPRYGKLWNAGVNSFTLADDETAVYLAIIACPKIQNAASGHSDYTLDNVAMFPYRISLSGATPRGWQWPAPTSGFTYHSNGGGIKASTATVDATAYVGPNAMVLGTAKVYGYSRIEDYAVVDSSAVIGRSGLTDNPVISGHAYVTGSAQVYGHGKVRDYGWVWGAARIYDNAIVMAHTMINGASVFGNAVMNQAPLRDSGLNYNGTYSGSAQVGGDCSSLGVMTSDKGVWCEFPAISVADNKYQYLGYNFKKQSCVFAMDQYGMNHSYLIGSPQVVGDSLNSVATGVLNLNGTNQYIELRPDAVDFADLTISTWVKWSGTDNDQMILSTGDGNTKVMYLTPKDATTGKLRWVISDGISTQSLNGGSALAPNTWTHVAITLATNTATLYVNGTAVDSNTGVTIDPDQLHAPLMADWNFIGRGNAGNYFAGRIDEFRVYNKALNAAEVAALLSDITPGGVPTTDTTPPTPNSATWLVSPLAAADNSITMSASEGSDAGGNGVLYYFRCVTDSSHDSGWISENKYTDCGCAAATTYTYAVRMMDKLGNVGGESGMLGASTNAAGTTGPSPNPPVFAATPKGISTTAIAMSASKGSANDGTVLYKFTRDGTGATSGWTGSRNWTDTGVSAGGSHSYTVQMMDGHGNTTSTTTSASAVARDDTAPALDTDFRLQWGTYPYTQLDKTVRMYAADPAETAVDYYYECVETPTINSGWTSNKMWVTSAMTDGTYTFRFKLRDRSPQLNESPWSTPRPAKILTTNCYHDYSLTQLATLPDSTLAKFSGKVTQVTSTSYTVSTTDGLTTINVVPRTFGYKTDSTLLNQNVNVKGHLWTYNGGAKSVTGAVVAGSPQSGKIEFENSDYDDDLARPLYDVNASGSEYLGWYQSGWSVTIPNVAAVTQLSLAYAGGGGTLSLYLNGTHYKNLTIPGTASTTTWGATTITGLSIPAGSTLKLQQDAGDTAPNLDYMILGPAYIISGKVTNSGGAAIAGATVYLSGAPNAALNPTYSAITDASGNYNTTVPNGTWYVAAAANSLGYITAADQAVVVNGANQSNINFTLQSITRSFPRASDLLFCCIPEMLPDAGTAGAWVSYFPGSLTLPTKGTPQVEMLGSAKWEKNSAVTQDGFVTATYSSPIAINGATIVVVVKPTRNTTYGYQYSVVNAFFDRLSLGIENPTGRVLVRCNGSYDWAAANTAIPDGQTTILSLVVQPTGQYKMYANGTQIMSATTTSDMTSLVPNVPGGYANTLAIGMNGPDGASTFNGNIGDVCFYKVALTDVERQTLEASMTSKYINSVDSYVISAGAGAGGSITPSGSITVLPGANQTFSITPNPGYVIAQVTVDSVAQGVIAGYTFNIISADHTINATFIPTPTPTVTLVRHSGTGSSSLYGDALSFDVTVAGTPSATGTITLWDGGTGGTSVASTTLVSGACSFTTTALATGSHPNIIAAYSGDSYYLSAVSSPLSTQTINKLTPTLSVTNPAVAYTGFPQTASVIGSVPGTASNMKYNGSATAPSAPGTYAITADFAPSDSTNYNILTGAMAGNFIISASGGLTTAGTATATVAGQTGITVTMPYSDDGNANNSYTVEYKFSAGGNWTPWVTQAAHTVSPYTTTLTGLTAGTSYDIRVTYNDADGVSGTNPQTLTRATSNPGITELSAWSNIYHGTVTQAQNFTYTVPSGSGSNRILVVAIASSRTSVGTRSVTLSYGGRTLTRANGDMSNNVRQHTALYYLTEAGLDAATSTTLAATISGGSSRVTDIFAAVYDGVDQVNPITDSKQYNGGTTAVSTFAFATGLTVSPGNQALEIISADLLGSTIPRTVTSYATNWSLAAEQTYTTSDAVRNMVMKRPIPTAAIPADITSTVMSGTSLGSMTAMSLANAKGTPAVVVANSPVIYQTSAQPAVVNGSVAGTVSNVKYDGSATLPTAVGTYAITADFVADDTLNYSNLTAAPAGNFVIQKAVAGITLDNLEQSYDGRAKSATVTTVPAGLQVSLTYDGTGTAPSAAGSYTVLASINDANYSGSASGTLVITGTALSTWRAAHFPPAEIAAGLAADGADLDGDGLINLTEYVLGTDPRVSNPQPLALSPAAGNTFTLTFLARAASGAGYTGTTRKYAVECTADLANPASWLPLPGYTRIVGGDQTVVINLPIDTAKKFYRLNVSLTD